MTDMKKIYRIQKLNERRLKIQENINNARIEQERILRKLETNKSYINSADTELMAINDELQESIDLTQIVIKVHLVNEFVPVKHKRLMLEIKVPGIKDSIFKLLTHFEIELLERAKSSTNSLLFNARIKRIASDFIMVHGLLDEKESIHVSSSESLDQYLEDYKVDMRINRNRFFIINNDTL